MLQPSLPYNILKFSLQMFHRAPHDLVENEYESVQQRAEEECSLQAKVLASKEGLQLIVPEKSVQEAMTAITERYESPEAFEQDMAKNDLDLKAMAIALEVDLAVEATMAHVAAQVDPPSESLVAKIFESGDHKTPEQRRVSHILITINDQFPENCRQAAQDRINKVHHKALAAAIDFSELAQRYSECPSALQGGSIGLVTQGAIQPAMEKTLFSMGPGEISAVVESTMGFHILLCEEILEPETIVPEKAKRRIHNGLHNKARKKAVQTWLASL